MMKSYKLISPNYAVVTLDDGSTFGQVIVGKTVSEIEAEIRLGCERAKPAITAQEPPPKLGVDVPLIV
jgi:hypothetical protein